MTGPRVTAVHATHVTDDDRTTLGDHGTRVCLCPTTERDLADGIGPARALADSGSPLCLGSDSHAVIDLFEEARAVELDERLRDEHRGHFDAGELLDAATAGGHAALGWPDAGRIAPGDRADLVTVRLDSVRTAGFDPVYAQASVFAGPRRRHPIVVAAVVVRAGGIFSWRLLPALADRSRRPGNEALLVRGSAGSADRPTLGVAPRWPGARRCARRHRGPSPCVGPAPRGPAADRCGPPRTRR